MFRSDSGFFDFEGGSGNVPSDTESENETAPNSPLKPAAGVGRGFGRRTGDLRGTTAGRGRRSLSLLSRQPSGIGELTRELRVGEAEGAHIQVPPRPIERRDSTLEEDMQILKLFPELPAFPTGS